MEKKDQNKLVMMKALVGYFKLNFAIWTTSIPFNEAVISLDQLALTINEIWKKTKLDQSGLIIRKNGQRQELVDDAFDVASQVFAYASKTSNTFLQGNVNFQISGFEGQRDNELTITSRTILDLATENRDGILPYGIDQNRLDNLDRRIILYEDSLPVSRVSVSERKALNAQQKELFGFANILLKDQIKRMMNHYAKSDPVFYAGYLNASMIIDYGTRHEELVIPVTPVV